MAKSFDAQVMNTAVINAVTESFKKSLKEDFSSPPTADTKSLLFNDFGGMQASGLRKFHGRSYVSVIYFYLSEKQSEKNEVFGTFVLYVRDSAAYALARSMGRTGQSEKNTEEVVMSAVGEICNIIAGNFKDGISNLGYKKLFTSTPQNYMDMVPQGAKVFDKGQKNYHEYNFYLGDVRAVVIDAVMADVPR